MSRLVDIIEGLQETWAESATLAVTSVLTRPPVTADEVSSADGRQEIIFIGQEFTVDREVPYMRAGEVDLEETWSIPVIVQVLASEDELVDAIERMEQLQLACMAQVQQFPHLGKLAGYTRFEAIYRTGRVHTGPLNEGFGARAEDTVEVTLRITV